MENRIIFRAGIKRHKGSLLGIAVLLFLTTLSLCTVLTVFGGAMERQKSRLSKVQEWRFSAPFAENTTRPLIVWIGGTDGICSLFCSGDYGII